jgi:membrane-bound serine protease (ClpP class)
LILLAICLFAAELFTPTFGALTAVGIAAFILGALILFNTSEFSYQIPIPSIIGIALSLAVIVGLGMRKVVQSMKNQPTTGREAMIDAVGTVKVPLDPQGRVLVYGEWWSASSEDGQPINVGEQIRVTKIDGFQLKVKKAE